MTCTQQNYKPLGTNEKYSFSIVLVLPMTCVKLKEKFPEACNLQNNSDNLVYEMHGILQR